MSKVPSYDVDFYADDFIQNPWPHYARMRELGPVVWLPQHGNYALTRHGEVAKALRDKDTFISGKGVAADARANELTLGNSAASDGERHSAIRSATSVPLLPGALESITDKIDEAAEKLIDELMECETFDTATNLATHLPLTIVRDLVGLPDFGRDNMLHWANAAFDLLGVQNARGKAAVNVFLEQRQFAQDTAKTLALKPGSWTRRLADLVEEGVLDAELAASAMRDYLNPSLDTTIAATSQLIYQLGMSPDQWDLLREKPELARGAANEAVRMASPVRSFSRHTSRTVEIGPWTIPKDARVMMLYASANRDHRVFESPDKFDITRNPRHHLGFGSGIHMCVGMHLAQKEMIALLNAMIPRVERIHVGEPVIALNNTIYRFASLPTRFSALPRPASVLGKKLEAVTSGASKTRSLLAGKIVKREYVAEDILGLDIEPAEGTVFPDWTPGAHVDVHVRDGLVRQYSLTGAVARNRYQIAVQLEPKSTGGSAALHSKFGVDSPVILSHPRNHFPLNENAHHHMLFSGGIGLTPIMAMAWRLHALGRDFTWHLSARSKARLPWAEQIEQLPFRQNIAIHLDDGARDQQLDAAGAMRDLPADTQIYICGPAGYMDHINVVAQKAGLSAEQIHKEHFAAEINVNGDPFTVIAARSGKEFVVSADETILAAAEREGLSIETACKNGVCGSCITGVLEGRPDHRDMVLTDAEKGENNQIAVCCSRSQSPVLVLDL